VTFDPQADGSDTLDQQCCNYAVVFFSSVHTLDTYAHCQKTCPFASLEVQSLLRPFAAQEPTRKMLRQSKSATLGNPWMAKIQTLGGGLQWIYRL